VWQIVSQRQGDGWRRPDWANARQLYLMVQFVETWLLTDPDGLAAYFKDGFRGDKLPRTNLEGREKEEIERALAEATRNTKKGVYRHGQAHEILEHVQPTRLRTLSHGMRLFNGIAELLTGQKDHFSDGSPTI
jgi:hypothetical protein